MKPLSMQKILFIINPISGTGRKEVVEAAIREHLDTERFDCRIRYTEYAGHAEVIAREEAEAGTDIVVAVGGDGTVNEVARSLVHTKTALGIIPCGSGNGLARHLRIPMEPAESIKLLNECEINQLDYGTINGQAFFCTCGVGFDAFISMKFAEAGKRGLATYIEKTLQDGLKYKPEVYHIEIEGEGGEAVEQEAFLIACANASQYGNNAYIAPEASTRDGLLDVTILTPFSPIEAPQIVVQMFNRQLTKNSHVRIFRTKRVRIRRASEGPVHIDGDPLTMGDNLEVELIAGGLNVVVNGHPGHRPLAFPRVQALNRDLENVQHDIEETFFRNVIEPFQRLENLRDAELQNFRQLVEKIRNKKNN